MTKTTVSEADHSFNDWLHNLDLHKQELEVLKNHLLKLKSKYTGPDIINQVLEYEDKFKAQHEILEQLSNRITENILTLNERAELDGAWHIDDGLGTQFHNLEAEYRAEEAGMNGLRSDFYQFSTALKSE